MSASRPSTSPKLLLPALALILAVVVTGIGAYLTITANATLNAALTSGTGTAADVYGSQSLISVGAALLTAGIVAIILAVLGFGLMVGLANVAAAAQYDEFDDDFDDAEDDGFEDAPEVPAAPVPAPAAPVAPAAEAAPEAPEAPAAEEPKRD
ncbi:hypothetical protein ACDF64_03710 [Agromyces sp. MMS24-JH15]|uniref:hypothetical protein n=1 Tax=Agromyces sp. MMS24-JH15 TaxID=3243765 RepID=UPI003749EA1D